MATGPSTVDKVLTSVSEAFTNDSGDFIAEKLLPVITVDRKSGKYWGYNKDNLRSGSTDIDLRTGRSKTREATYGKELKDFGPLQEHALKDFISKDEYEMSDDPLNPETDVTLFLNERMQLAAEISAAAMLTNTTIITNNSSPTVKWDDAAADPIADITAAIKAQTGKAVKMPNSISFGVNVWLSLVNNAKMIERFKYSERGILTQDMFLAALAPLGITNIFIGKAVVNSAKEGQATDVLANVWSDNVILSYVAPNPGLRTTSGGYTLRLKNGKYVDKWDDNDPKGKWVRNNDYYDQMIFNTDTFYLLTNVLAA